MNFLENLLRYPRFFFSSMLGLILILLEPIRKLSKEIKNTRLFLVGGLVFIGFLTWTLNLMINPGY